MPQWLVVLMVLAGLVFLGPPALGLLAGLIGITIGLVAVAIKFGIIALGIYAAVLVLKALFGGPERRRVAPPSIDSIHEAALARDEEEMRRLDAELARVMAQQKSL
jgi:hypothetical protein